MPITALNHVNLRTGQLQAMVHWYTHVLGLVDGPRPAFPFAGAWLYAGDTAVVHLVEVDNPHAVGSEVELKLEHFAFSATDHAAFEARLNTTGTRYKQSTLAEAGLALYNLWDPDGNHIHVDFPLDG